MKKGKMMIHKPLKFIKDGLIFLPVSGPLLVGQPIGRFICPFQEDIITSCLDHEGNPKKNLFIGWSRKLSKSMSFSWILSYFLAEKHGFISVTMASTFGQSAHIYDLVREQIERNPNINEEDYKLTKELLVHTERGNKLFRVYNKASSNLGMIGVGCVVIDQIESMTDRRNIDSIQSGMMMSQVPPLYLLASNPPESVAHWSLDYIKAKQADKRFKFFDFSAPLKEPWQTVEAKKQANPFYKLYKESPKKYPHLKGLVANIDAEEKQAIKSGEEAITYRKYLLGQRISAKTYQWVDVKDIQIASEDVYKNKDLRPILAFDLALTHDFCSALLCLFDEDTEDIYLKPVLHIANLDNRRFNQQKRFKDWDAQGFITIQNEKVISKALFISDVKKLLKEKNIVHEKDVWDRNLSTGWTDEFGSDPELYKGTASELAHAIRFVEARSREGKLHFIGENPCLKWMFDCAICSQKSKGFTLLDRPTVYDSIDGAVCCVLATKYFIENRQHVFKAVIV